MNRKGDLGDKTMLIVFLFFLMLVGVGIAFGVTLFFGLGYDFRQAEADVLNYKVVRCILEKDIDFDSEGDKDFFEKCELKESTIRESKKHAIKVSIDEDVVFDWRTDEAVCLIKKKTEGFPKCKITEFVKDGKEYRILTESSQFAVGEKA